MYTRTNDVSEMYRCMYCNFLASHTLPDS